VWTSYLGPTLMTLSLKNMKKAPFIISVILPTIIYGMFERHGFLFFLGVPFLLVVTLLVALLVNFLAKKYKISLKTRQWILLSLSLLFSIYLGTTTYSRYTSVGQFKANFKVDPPSSLTNLEMSGVVSIAGGRQVLTFNISSSDCELLITNLDMPEVSENDLSSKKEFQFIQEKDYKGIFPGQKIYINSKFEGMSYQMIITNKDKTKVYYLKSRI